MTDELVLSDQGRVGRQPGNLGKKAWRHRHEDRQTCHVRPGECLNVDGLLPSITTTQAQSRTSGKNCGRCSAVRSALPPGSAHWPDGEHRPYLISGFRTGHFPFENIRIQLMCTNYVEETGALMGLTLFLPSMAPAQPAAAVPAGPGI